MYVHMHGFPARVVFFLKYLWKLQTNNSPSQTLFLFQLPDVYLQIHRQMPSLLSGFQEVCVERNIQPNPPWFMNYPSLHIPLWFLRKLCSLRFKKKTLSLLFVNMRHWNDWNRWKHIFIPKYRLFQPQFDTESREGGEIICEQRINYYIRMV